MCGIIGYIGFYPSYNYLLNGLRQLQNRGYDSVGLCTIMDNKYVLTKYADTLAISALDKLDQNKDVHISNTIGIGHTRWATHGVKTDENAHPHISMKGLFSLSHNGIIENFKEIKNKLTNLSYTFKSTTDTEIIVNLLEYEYNLLNNENIREKITKSIRNTLQQLEGTWGLTILCLDDPNSIYCTRRGSPLLVAVTEKYGMVASEQSGFNKQVNNYIILRDADICVMSKDKDTILLSTLEKYTTSNINKEELPLDPHPYHHWTIREINEQSDACERVLDYGGRLISDFEVRLGGLSGYSEELMKLDNILLLGCGTSFHSALMGTHYLKDLCDFSTVQAIDGSEFTSYDIPKQGKTGLLLLSQSGETKDLHNCISIGRENNLVLIGIVNVVDSLIARDVDCGCYLHVGRERAVASTKSFLGQVILLSLIAIWFAQNKDINISKRIKYIDGLRRLHQDIVDTISMSNNTMLNYVEMFEEASNCFVVGKGKGEIIARESALKIKEISYVHAEGYSASSLRHGPFALLSEKFPVLMVAPTNCFYSKVLNTFYEIESRSSPIIFITDNRDMDYEKAIYVPNNPIYADLLCLIPLQFLAYLLSINKNINPDYPRNLSKVVTVE